MFKLTIAFASLVELSKFVTQMGGQVVGGTISHDQPITNDAVIHAPTPAAPTYGGPALVTDVQTTPGPALTPQQKAAQTRANKKAAEAANAPQPVATMPTGAFPGAAPVSNFAPGNLGMGAPAQPTNFQNVAPVQQAQPVAQPPVMMAPPMQAPVQVSPERQQYNDECGKLLNSLAQTGIPETDLSQVVINSFNQAGCPLGSTISKITDAEIQRFYPILHANVSAVFAQLQAR